MTSFNVTDFEFPDLSNTIGAPVVQAKRPLLTKMEGTEHDYILQIDNTTMSVFQTCPRAAKFYTVHRRQRPDRAPLIFGGAIHEGLEHLYKHGYGNESLVAARQAILSHFTKHPYNSVGEWRTPSYAIEAFNNYIKQYNLIDPFHPIDSDWVERAFALNIGSFEINSTIPFHTSQLTNEDIHEPMYIGTLHAQWSGKIDLITDHIKDELYVVDHKTSSMGGPTFFQDFELAGQTHGYMWAGQEILERPIAGFILNALIIRKPSRTGVGFECDRKTYNYTQESLLEWKTDMLQSFESFVYSLCNDAFPKHTGWCMGKYGRCQYHDVCTLPKAQQRIMLGSDQYSNVTWSPLNED